MEKKNIFVVHTTLRDPRELDRPEIKEKYNIFFQDYDDNVFDELLCLHHTQSQLEEPAKIFKDLKQFCFDHKIHAVFSTDDYPGSLYSNALAHELGLYGASPASVLSCQHKYYSRLSQKQFVPEAAPEFTLVHAAENLQENSFKFPLFIKPVKSYFSIMADVVWNSQDIQKALKHSAPALFLQPLDWLLQRYTAFDAPTHGFLLESLLSGQQVTLEGYVYRGEVYLIGIVDSIMYPETRCFNSFDYPSSLPQAVQARMFEISQRLLKGIEFDNSFFNIEFIYNPAHDQIHILEVNPRMCSQFADLYEKVDGYNTYAATIELALGEKPKTKYREGKYKTATSHVMRLFENKKVKNLPTQEQKDEFYRYFPDGRIEIAIKSGQYLKEIIQDGKSFRYCVINMGADNWQQMREQISLTKKLLKFEFE